MIRLKEFERLIDSFKKRRDSVSDSDLSLDSGTHKDYIELYQEALEHEMDERLDCLSAENIINLVRDRRIGGFG